MSSLVPTFLEKENAASWRRSVWRQSFSVIQNRKVTNNNTASQNFAIYCQHKKLIFPWSLIKGTVLTFPGTVMRFELPVFLTRVWNLTVITDLTVYFRMILCEHVIFCPWALVWVAPANTQIYYFALCALNLKNKVVFLFHSEVREL